MSSFSTLAVGIGYSDRDLTRRSELMDRVINTPHVAESAFSMECDLMHWYEIKNDAGDSTNTVMLGRIRRFHIVSVPSHTSVLAALPYNR